MKTQLRRSQNTQLFRYFQLMWPEPLYSNGSGNEIDTPLRNHILNRHVTSLSQGLTSIRGKTLGTRLQRYAETPNTTVNLMCSLPGVDYANTVNGSADTIDFLRFFEEAYRSINLRTARPVLEPGSVIVMDNCATHHNQGGQILQEFLNDLGIELVYMPAYSPDFNPAEYCVR